MQAVSIGLPALLIIFCAQLLVVSSKEADDCPSIKRIGCYKAKQDGSPILDLLILTDRDPKSHVYSGINIKWDKWNSYMADLAYRCADRAEELGYDIFGIQFYGECWSSATQNLTSIKSSTPSKECAGDDFKLCSPTEIFCVGKADVLFVYQLKSDSCECDSNAVCIKSQDTYKCECKEGFVGDGNVCATDTFRGLSSSSILSDYGNLTYLQDISRFLRPVLQDPSKSRWIRCWRAATDGWDVTQTFHPQCDNKGPTVTLIRVKNFIFGGYSDASWDVSSTYAKSSDAFLFSLYNIRGYNPLQFSILGLSNAIFRYKVYGPTFGGGHDILVSNNAINNNISAFCPYTYNAPPGCKSYDRKCSFYTGTSGRFSPDDIEVFYEVDY